MYFLNKGLILEEEIVKAFNQYFASLRIDLMFPNYTLNITNEHPFALYLDQKSEANGASLFPAIVVTSENDGHAPPGGHLEEADRLILEPEDCDQLIEYGYMVEPEMVERIKEEFEKRSADDKKLYGWTMVERRTERILVQIWAENIKLKNYLYEMLRLFILGAMMDYLCPLHDKNNLVLFDETITGQRSGAYSLAYGMRLAGANIIFDMDYIIEQSFIDTEYIKVNDPVIVEVKHGAK
jgi:hypothetical protein